jgi:predicted nucleotide-binding protein
MAEKIRLFISYSRRDAMAAERLTRALIEQGADVFLDIASIEAGENWQKRIQSEIERADALVFLLSRASAESSVAYHELSAAVGAGILVIPIALEELDRASTPPALANLNYITAFWRSGEVDWDSTSRLVLNAVSQEPARRTLDRRIDQSSAAELAETITSERRGERASGADEDKTPPDSVFLVHGHDEPMLREVETFLSSVGVRPIIMQDVGDRSMSLLQKFFRVSGEAKFAIVMVSGDDLGAEKHKAERWMIGKWALKLRARQNVILELGYFFGLLGWERVFVLQREDRGAFRDFEMPSDLGGVPFVSFDTRGKWKGQIRERLIEHDFRLRS